MNNLISKEDVYVAFRKAQSFAKSRPYRLPKDWSKHYQKMSLDNRNALSQVTHFFNTKWKEIDPEQYFLCGFELLKTFSYHNFTFPQVIKLYIQKDKAIKRQTRMNKGKIVQSVKFVKDYMGMTNMKSFLVYCNTRVNNRLLPVKHYLENYLDIAFLTWLLKDKLIRLNDDERAMIPYVVDKYRENVLQLESIQDFLNKLRKML